MSVNILNLLKDQIGDQLSSNASDFLGAPQANVSSALDGIFPALLGKMVDSADDDSMLEKLFGMATKTNFDGLGDIADIFTGGGEKASGVMNMGGTLINLLMGNKTGAIIDLIANFAGLKGSTTSSLLKLAAPFLLKVVGNQVSGANLNIGGFKDLLLGQKDNVSKAMPSGLDLGTVGFLGEFKEMMSDAVESVSDVAEDAIDKAGDLVSGAAGMVDNAVKSTIDTGKNIATDAAEIAENVGDVAVKSGGSLLKWLIPALLILAALSFFGIKTCTPVDKAGDMVVDATSATVDMAGEAAGAAAEATADAAVAVGDAASTVVELSLDFLKGAFSNVNAVAKKTLDAITFTAGSAGEQMMGFITNGFEGSNTFRFNNLKFNTGSAAIDAETAVEVDNIAAILNTYPDVKISIDGYTDNTGDATKNVQLSQARADAVKARLMAKGITGNRLYSRGHGDASPIGDNSTMEGQASNRRIEITIIK